MSGVATVEQTLRLGISTLAERSGLEIETSKIIDHPIGYAYSDQVLDSIPWGNRVYMYNVKRDGGNFAWMANNLDKAKGSPKASEINAKWTFGGAWDPEAKIQSLWNVLGYKKGEFVNYKTKE